VGCGSLPRAALNNSAWAGSASPVAATGSVSVNSFSSFMQPSAQICQVALAVRVTVSPTFAVAGTVRSTRNTGLPG